MLDQARGIAGVPFKLTSTTGGNHATNSAHYRGLAVDIGLGHLAEGFDRDTARFAIVSGLVGAGFKRIEICPLHIHADIGQPPDYVSPIMWLGEDSWEDSMLERLKWYVVQVGIKKYAPVGAMAALGALGTFMMAHAGLLEKYGVTYGIWPFTWPTGQEPSGPCILVELDTLSATATTVIVALVTMAIRAGEHHTVGAVTQIKPLNAENPQKETK